MTGQFFLPHLLSASALSGEIWTNEICIKMNRNTSKSILNIIDCYFEKDWQILIIFDANISDNWLSNENFSLHLIYFLLLQYCKCGRFNQLSRLLGAPYMFLT